MRATGPRRVWLTDVNLDSDIRALFGAAAEECLKLEDDVIKVFLHFGSAHADGEVEDDRARSRLDRDPEKVRTDQSQRCLTSLNQEVVPPQQCALVGRRDHGVVVLPGGMIHAPTVSPAGQEQRATTRRGSRARPGTRAGSTPGSLPQARPLLTLNQARAGQPPHPGPTSLSTDTEDGDKRLPEKVTQPRGGFARWPRPAPLRVRAGPVTDPAADGRRIPSTR